MTIRARLARVTVVLTPLAAACGGQPLAPRLVDRWGSAGAELRQYADSAELQLDCETADFPRPIVIDPRGAFAATGAFTTGVRAGDTLAVGGTVTADTMRLSAALPEPAGQHEDASFVLLRGVAGTFDSSGCAPHPDPGPAPREAE